MTYTDVFGSATLPPSEYGYASFTLTTNATFVWPYNTNGSPYPVAKVMDIACDAGNEVTLPDCTEVSTGEDFLIRNVGANVLTVKDAAGVQVASVAVGAASYFYLADNTSAAGVFGVIGFGVGTSTADASSLVGYGIKAVGASLNQAHPVQPTNTGITLSADHRAKLIVFTGGVATFTLDSAATLGDDYFTMFRNDGTGTATIDPAASELIDGMASMQVQPGESLMLICTGTKWYSVGYGRSTLYQFTQLTKDVSAGGTITLSATEAANKLITFIGNPSAAVEVVVPAVVAVYYTQSAISTAHTITLKTSAGSGVGINQGTRVIALCDGTNVVSAQSAVANTSVSLTDGSALVPSLFFAAQTNTGLFKSGTQDVGVTIGGSAVAVFGSTGLQTTTIGPNSMQRHTLPAVPSDTVTLNTATQTLTDKTISVDNNTISGIAASSFVLSNASGNIDGSAAQKVIPTGVVVGTTDTQTLTNKTLSSPIISSPTGITKGDVGLGNVDNTSDDTKNAATATLTNKTINLTNNTLTGTTAQFNTALSDGDFATLAGVETLTNKTFSLANNTLTGTLARFNTACSDADFASLAGVETLTNKTLDSTNNIVAATGNMFGFRNKIINGKMDIAQRGASGTSANTYTLDRWILFHAGTAPSWARVSGGTINGVYFSNLIEIGGVTGGNTAINFNQRIESLNSADLCGKTVTFSAYVLHTNTGGPRDFTIITQRPNTADNWSGVTSIGNSGSISVPLNVWTRITWTTTLPASGPNFGLSFEIHCGAIGATQSVYITGVQLEAGSIATPFEHRPYGTELALCQSYAFALTTGAASSTEMIAHGYCAGGVNQRFRIVFPVVMRATPTISFISGSESNLITDVPGTVTGGFVIDNGSPLGMNIVRPVTGGTASFAGHLRVNGVSNVIWMASAEL